MSPTPKKEWPYAPSWVDRLTEAVERMPLPVWASYGLAAVFLATVFVLVQYLQGAYDQLGFFEWHIFIALQPLLPVAAIHYLDGVALDALHRFRPAMKGGASAFASARYRLTTTPSRGANIAGVAGVFISVLIFIVAQDPTTTYRMARLAPSDPSIGIFLLYILVAWFGFGAWVYHTIHQLRTIHNLYAERAQVDPFHPEPMYSLSAITSRTAIVILANTYGWFGANAASGGADPNSLIALLVTNAFFIGLGLLIFVWPLWGAHRLLESAKSEALSANAAQFTSAVAEIHQRVAAKEMTGVEGWETALSALHVERLQLDRMPTWPWTPGALRNLVLALLVPILVWFAQLGLERLFE